MANPALIKQGAERRGEMLRFIRSFVAENGFAPNITEIAEAVGLSSPNGIRVHLQTLQEQGYLTVRARTGRAIALVSPAPDGWTR